MMHTPTTGSNTIPDPPPPPSNPPSYLDDRDFGFLPAQAAAAPAAADTKQQLQQEATASSSYPLQHQPQFQDNNTADVASTWPYLGQAPSTLTLGPEDSMSVVGESSHQPYPMFDDGYGGHGHGQQNDGSGGYGYHDPYGGGVYSQGGGRNDLEERGLVGDAAGMAGRPTSQYSPLESSVPPHASEGADGMDPGHGGDLEDQQTKSRGAPYGGMRYDDGNTAFENRSLKTRFLESFGIGAGKYPLEQRIENKRRGIGRQSRPWACYVLAVAMVAMMAYELIRNAQLTGSAIATKPTFNWMIGPSSSTLINIGARFVPCMKEVADVPLSFGIACLNNTSASPTKFCTIADICGIASTTEVPRQTWRFFVPIFLHAGLVHIALNLLFLMSAGAQIEKEVGSLSFLIIFFAGAIFGFELGGNFALVGIPAVGASGGLFAVNAVTLVDLLIHWKYEPRPKLKLFFLILELVVMVGLGFIPFVIDNFSHIGGFIMGILLGVILYPSISPTKRHATILWIARIISFGLVILAFVLVTINFYKPDSTEACSWCRYLSCLPIAQTNYCKGTGLTSVTTSTTRRAMWEL